jgi:hypothetical protein
LMSASSTPSRRPATVSPGCCRRWGQGEQPAARAHSPLSRKKPRVADNLLRLPFNRRREHLARLAILALLKGGKARTAELSEDELKDVSGGIPGRMKSG